MASQLALFPTEQLKASGAIFSPDGMYRYWLWRRWDRTLSMLGGLLNNSSTADAQRNDPTMLRFIHRAKLEGFGGMLIANMYAYRTPSPQVLWQADADGIDIVGPQNDTFIRDLAKETPTILLGFGNLTHQDRMETVLNMLNGADLRHLGLTNSGRPKHPLSRGKGWIPDSQPLALWRSR